MTRAIPLAADAGTTARRAGPSRLSILAVYASLAAVHVALGWPMRQPHIFPDELGYLGQARYLAGAGELPDMGQTSYYHFGYSLFLVPAFRLFASDPGLAYLAAIVTNSLLIATLFPALVMILRTSFDVSARGAVGAALVTSLYPAFLLQSNFAWAENALIPAYAWWLAAFAALRRRGSLWPALVFGLLAGLLYALHPRTLAVLPAAALTLGVLSWRRLVPWTHTLAGLGALTVVFAATRLASARLRSLGWSAGEPAVSVGSFLGRVTSAEGLWGTAIGAVGQGVYLVASTYGLCLVPLLWLLAVRRDAGRDTHRNGPALATVGFALLTSLALLAPAAVAVSNGGTRADHLVYGRYNEMFLPIWIALGLVLMREQALGRVAVRSVVLLVLGVLTALMVAIRGDDLLTRDVVAPNIFGLYAFVRAIGRVDLLVIAGASAAGFLLVSASFRRSPVAGHAVVAAAFIAGTLYGYPYCTSAQAWIASRDALPARIRGMGGVGHVSYDIPEPITQNMDFGQPQSARYFSTQFLLPRTRVHAFSSERGERPSEPVVISTRRWRDARALQARYVTSELGAETALWLLPSSPHYLSASERYLDVALGWRWFPGVWESGFHATEQSGRTRFRWTNGAATLVVPVNEFPAALVTDLSPSDADAGVRITVNGVELWDGAYPAGRRAFDLAACPVTDWVTIELSSDTFVPQARDPASSDRRTLGVAVREVRLASAP